MQRGKNKNKIFVLGCVIIAVTALLLLYGILVVTGVIHFKDNQLVFTAESATKIYDGTPLVAEKWELTSGKLSPDHRVVASVSGERTEPGITPSHVSVRIYDSRDVDVTDEYEVICVDGALNIKGMALTIKSNGHSKEYDGEPISDPWCDIVEGVLLPGHEFSGSAMGYIKDIGKVDNAISFTIVDGEGKDVSNLYDINRDIGILEIRKIALTIHTYGDTKLYDGQPLSRDEYYLEGEGKLLPGHRAEVTVVGKAVGKETVKNTAYVKILDQNGVDQSAYYEIIEDFGELRVVGPPGTEGEGGDGVGGEMSGKNINDPSKNGANQADLEVLKITASTNGTLLLKLQDFGDYIYHGWDDAPTNQLVSGTYLASEAIGMNFYEMDNAHIEILADYGYLTPYYAVESTVDTTLRDYYVSYYKYNYLTAEPLELTSTNEEKMYRSYVYSEYLELPSGTQYQMVEHLKSKGLLTDGLSLLEIVGWVERYIRGAAEYDLHYAERVTYPDDADTALYFLTEAKVGVCRHFATAATVAYRALGIPARYTVGFSAQVKAGEEVLVKGDRAHAWVEVYIDNLGWVSVDPTAGSSGEEETEEEDNRNEIVLYMDDVKRPFNGMPFTAQEVGHRLEGMLNGNDELIVEYEGSITYPGTVTSSIKSCRVVDENGNDVTENYKIDYSDTGTLTVTASDITLSSGSDEKVYDKNNPTPLVCYEPLKLGNGQKLAEGHELQVTYTGSQTEIGISENTFDVVVLDAEDNDVTHYYNITKDYGELLVAYAKLVFKTEGGEKDYDGRPLVASEGYELISGSLYPGHTISEIKIDASITEPGVIFNTPEFTVWDENGENVTHLYIVGHEELGILRVNYISITVRSGDAEMVYDPNDPKKVLSCSAFTIDGKLISGHRAEVRITASLSSVGECDNQIDSVTIVDITGKNVTRYYKVTLELGVLHVYP